MASQAGIDLIATINEELLKSAKLTGLWENKLRRIERGDYSASEFISELKTQISEIVLNVLSDNSARRIMIEPDSVAKTKDKDKKAQAKVSQRIKNLEQIKCPKCGEGHLLKGKTAYGCSLFRSGCDLKLTFDDYPSDLTPAKLYSKIKKNYNGK